MKTKRYLVFAYSPQSKVYEERYYNDLQQAKDKYAELVATLPNYVSVELRDTEKLTNQTISQRKLARVLFYEFNEDQTTFHRTGMSPVTTPAIALEYYANTPNPASQLIEADNITALWLEVLDIDRKMADPKYTKKYILPCL